MGFFLHHPWKHTMLNDYYADLNGVFCLQKKKIEIHHEIIERIESSQSNQVDIYKIIIELNANKWKPI